MAQTAGLPPESKLFPTVPISKCQSLPQKLTYLSQVFLPWFKNIRRDFFLLTHSFKSYYSSNGAFLKYGYKNIYDSDILRFQSGSQSRMISNPQPCFIQPKVYVYKKNSSQKSISFLFFINFSNITNTLSSLLLAKFRLPMLVYWWWF